MVRENYNEREGKLNEIIIESIYEDKADVHPKPVDTLGDKVERFFESNEYGIAAFTKEVEDVDFPITKQELLNAVGDKDVQWFEDSNRVNLRDIIVNLRQDRFDTINDLLEAIGRDVNIRRV